LLTPPLNGEWVPSDCDINLKRKGRKGSLSCLFKSWRTLFDARGYSCSSGGCVALGSVFPSAARLRELFLRSLEGLVALSAVDSSVVLGDAVSPRPLGDGVTPVLPLAPRVPLVDGLAVAPDGVADALVAGEAVAADEAVAAGEAVAVGEAAPVAPAAATVGEAVAIGLAVVAVVVLAPPVAEV